MAKYYLTNLAVKELSEIWIYTFETWSEEQADTYYHQLIHSFESLAKNPFQGHVYDNIRPDLYGFKINKHIVFYRHIADDLIEITRILHERMDLKNRL